MGTKYTKEEAKIAIQKLVERYNNLAKEGRLNSFNEAMTKNNFIEPLFQYLNWDLRNEEAEEVFLEENVSKGYVDYAFKLGGVTKFFLEAKAIKEDLDTPKFAEQAITYGWHKGVTWAILTDFEGLKVFNCEWKEKSLWQNVVFSLHCAQYSEEFEKLWLLSKDSFLQNELDKYAEKIAKKIPRKKISEQLLEELTGWRKALSSDLSRKYKEHYSEDDLDEIVQRILDRLLFIRNCEDRGFEERKLYYLQQEWKERGKNPGAALTTMFRDYDQSYNSKLFEPHDADKVEIEPETLGRVLEGLYYTQDHNIQYDFSIIDADILGNLYEQYLGHLLKKTAKRAKVEEKHAHRKEQGIYYTPTYIVEYIVNNTVGELLNEGADPKKLRILDPACGSGSFLIKAFDKLNEHHKKNKKIKQATLDAEDWFSLKVEILKNNIFGVDLDPKAVEIAQLNLLLKAAEKKHRLPTLKQNIKCGNSLIEDPTVSPRAFKWEEEFKDVMSAGGFDAVIGNPPYGADLENYKDILLRTYKTNLGKMNSYRLFVERAIELVKNDGFIGVIIPNTWLSDNDSTLLRELILTKTKIIKVLVLPESLRVFGGVTQATTVVILQKTKNTEKIKNNRITFLDDVTKKYNFDDFVSGKIKQELFYHFDGYKILTKESVLSIINKIQSRGKERLPHFFNINQGEVNLTVYKEYLRNKKETNTRLLIRGNNISRYFLNLSANNKEGQVVFSNLKRDDSDKKRIVLQEVSNMAQKRRLKATLLDYPANLAHTCNYLYFIEKDGPEKNLLYFLGLLNSKVLDFYFKIFSNTNHISGKELRALPIILPPEHEQEPLIKLVDKMLSLNRRLSELGDKQTDESKRLEEDIKKMDALIDQKVYDLYGLTESERMLLEESIN